MLDIDIIRKSSGALLLQCRSTQSHNGYPCPDTVQTFLGNGIIRVSASPATQADRKVYYCYAEVRAMTRYHLNA